MRAKTVIEAETGDARSFLKKLGKVNPDASFFDWENFNPDTENDPDALTPWIQFIGYGVRPCNVANFWFPQRAGRVIAVRKIRGYLWNKKTAMELRLAGNIQRAREYEAICDRIYDQLPGYAAW